MLALGQPLLRCQGAILRGTFFRLLLRCIRTCAYADFLAIYVFSVTNVVLCTQGFGRLSVVAASAAQSAANVVQAGTKEFTSKVLWLFRSVLSVVLVIFVIVVSCNCSDPISDNGQCGNCIIVESEGVTLIICPCLICCFLNI